MPCRASAAASLMCLHLLTSRYSSHGSAASALTAPSRMLPQPRRLILHAAQRNVRMIVGQLSLQAMQQLKQVDRDHLIMCFEVVGWSDKSHMSPGMGDVIPAPLGSYLLRFLHEAAMLWMPSSRM